jgi:hypothetical protein
VFTDKQNIFASNFSNHNLGVKSNYRPISNLTIKPYTGYQRAQNRSNIDWGWDVGMDANYDQFTLDNYEGNIDGHLDYDFYPGRQNTNQGIALKFETQFTPVTSDSIKLKYDHSNKQYYAPNADSLINVEYAEKFLHNFFEYKISSSTNLALQTILSSKNVFDDSRTVPKRDVLKLENRLNLNYFIYSFFLNFGFDTFQETQNNSKLNTDSEALQSNIRTNISYFVSAKDQINLRFALTKFQFDTPDSVDNNDDRDELRISGSIEYFRQFSPVFSFAVEAYFNFFHQVYIFKERSANNNWNRIFRLSTIFDYKVKSFSNKLRNEILANYTVYDFEKQFTQSQSYIFRKYIIEDSLSIKLLPRLYTGLNSRYEFEDKGSFFKSEFAQQIIQSTQSIYTDLFFRFKNIYLLDFDCGVALYLRNDWLHIPTKSLIRDVQTTTPYLRIRYGLNDNLHFVSSASYVFSEEMNIGNSTYTTGSLSLIHQF